MLLKFADQDPKIVHQIIRTILLLARIAEKRGSIEISRQKCRNVLRVAEFYFGEATDFHVQALDLLISLYKSVSDMKEAQSISDTFSADVRVARRAEFKNLLATNEIPCTRAGRAFIDSVAKQYTPLYGPWYRAKALELIRSLRGYERDGYTSSPRWLPVMAMLGDLSLVQMCLGHASVQYGYKNTALLEAVVGSQYTVVRSLLQHDADPNTWWPDEFVQYKKRWEWSKTIKYSLLTISTERKDWIITRLLLNAGADPTKAYKDCISALGIALSSRVSDLVNILFEDETALKFSILIAINVGYTSSEIRSLISRGADVNYRYYEHYPLDRALGKRRSNS